MLSKSSLNTYLTCPRLYKFIYVDKIPLEIKSPAAQRGLDVHQFGYDFYDHVVVSGSEFYVDEQWLEEQLLIATDEARPYIENFIEFERKRWKVCVEHSPDDPGKYFFPILREQKIVNLGLEMIGIVDRVDLNFDDKTYTVVDYKTEKYDRRGWKLAEHRREMAFYKKLLESSNLLKGEVTHFAIYYPRSNDVWSEKFKWQTVNSLERKLKQVRKAILAEKFPCKVSPLCRWCDCNHLCDFGETE